MIYEANRVLKAQQQRSTAQPTTTKMILFLAVTRVLARKKDRRYHLKRQRLSKTNMERIMLQKGKTKERTQARKDEKDKS